MSDVPITVHPQGVCRIDQPRGHLAVQPSGVSLAGSQAMKK